MKTIRILNRMVTWTDEGIEYEGDQRHVEIACREYGLKAGSKAIKLPGAKDKLIADISGIGRANADYAIVHIAKIPIIDKDEVVVLRKMKIATYQVGFNGPIFLLYYIFIIVETLFDHQGGFEFSVFFIEGHSVLIRQGVVVELSNDINMVQSNQVTVRQTKMYFGIFSFP